MAREKCRWRTVRWFLLVQLSLCLVVLGTVEGLQDSEESNTAGKNLVLEYFLPIDSGRTVEIHRPRERRDVEGSGDDESFTRSAEKDGKESEEEVRVDSVVLPENQKKNGTEVEGSGDGDDGKENDKEETNVPLIGESEILTTTIENLSDEKTTEEATVEASTLKVDHADAEEEETSREATETETSTVEPTTAVPVMGITELVHLVSTTSAPTAPVESPTTEETHPAEVTTVPETDATTTPEVIPVPGVGGDKSTEEFKKPEEVPVTTAIVPMEPTITTKKAVPLNTENNQEPDDSVLEPIFTETKMAHKTVEARPGNILQKKNLTLGVDPLLIITNTGMMESEGSGQMEGESRRLGAYIVIGLILLSFSSLVGYIMFRKRQNRKRHHDFEANQESNDTEKALLSLSDYKDNSELEENHLKNNEITPIVVKSNSQINKFEKNTNFSSPKNLNRIANEKNIEKDNVLKSTSDNLTQVIVEETPKDGEEEKTTPNMEKLIVKTRIDQDSIPKKPIIVNKSSSGYLPIPQENS
ncbi:hypothetical protein RUM43_012169 [Polyplax serrata]|uniref:Uncharacterized protein n=1 Tax=Polyplax serrata TaxID=468196 RepID=A0AAN8PCY4_POLSC